MMEIGGEVGVLVLLFWSMYSTDSEHEEGRSRNSVSDS